MEPLGVVFFIMVVVLIVSITKKDKPVKNNSVPKPASMSDEGILDDIFSPED